MTVESDEEPFLFVRDARDVFNRLEDIGCDVRGLRCVGEELRRSSKQCLKSFNSIAITSEVKRATTVITFVL